MIHAQIIEPSSLTAKMEAFTAVSTGNYNDLTNKPTINGVIVEGDKELQDFGLDIVSSGFIEDLFLRRNSG